MAAIIAANASGKQELTEWVALPTGAALFADCWFYLKAKKRSGGWMLLLIPLPGLAPFVYWWMDDCSAERENIACAVCGAANFPEDKLCRLCKSPIPTPVI
jgi:hypothetical protein